MLRCGTLISVTGPTERSAAPEAVPDVSILVVTWNSAEDIEACLDSALAQASATLSVEVVVVDNASTDGTAKRLEAYQDRATVVLLEENTGYAAGNNYAAALAAGRHLLLLNPDCALDPGAASHLVGSLDSTPGLGAAAAMLRNPDGSAQLFARRDVSLPLALWAFTATGVWLDGRFRGGRHRRHRTYADVWPPAHDVDVDCPAAAAVAVPRVLVTREQLFDEGLPLLFNDADLYRRLRHECYAVRVVVAAGATHGYGTGLRQVGIERMRAETVASLQTYVTAAWGGLRRSALTTALLLDALLALCLLTFLRGPGRATARQTVRGTLGGLGLPGGARPWLAVPSTPLQRVRRAAGRMRDVPRRWVVAGSRRGRRRVFLLRLRIGGWISRCQVEVSVHPSADLGRGIRVELPLGGSVQLEIGPRARIQRHATLRLAGALSLGERCDVREGAVLNVKGSLTLGPRVMVGRGTMVHADDTMVWEWGATVAEFVSVLDSGHVVDGSLLHAHDQPTRNGPTRLEASCLVGTHVVVLPGVRIGRSAMIGAGAVVTRDVPPRAVASGVPAKVRSFLGEAGS
jgi:GT2 family glycosyltransferase/acetyltransferase-like isoleucine patch superfamily enzyme